MTNLYFILGRLDLANYYKRFQEEGFETWETVLDITESDLEFLGVKLGHRRILQKEIANSRGVGVERARPNDDVRSRGLNAGHSNTAPRGKRKYRRHPKADKNAPDRPPSAYVIFSNKVREEVKPENLSFTAIAKRVGERWQELSAAQKDPYESEASAAKETYYTAMAEYKNTREYRDYDQYLTDFKTTHTSNTGEKRSKVAKTESTASSGSVDGSQPDAVEAVTGSEERMPGRPSSISSSIYHFSESAVSSPTRSSHGPKPGRGVISTMIPLGTTSPITMSLSSPSASRDSSDGPYSPNSMQTRPSIEYPDRMMQSARSQPSARGPAQTSGLNWGQLQAERGNTLGRGVDPAPFQGRTSRPSSSQRVTRAPLLSYQTTSDSSSMSSLSAVSNADTAVSSLPYSVEEGNKNVSDRSSMSLPPISAVGLPPFSGSSLYPDPSKCDIQDPSANWTASPYYASQTPQARLNPSSSAGMSFESLQLARLHNMSFGQLRLTHPAHEETLANTFDLAQDLPQERHSLRSLTLQHEHGGATSTSRPCLPKPRLPPHQISLPKLPSMSSPDRDKQECAPANKNALHVLALAGNMVERRQSPPPP